MTGKLVQQEASLIIAQKTLGQPTLTGVVIGYMIHDPCHQQGGTPMGNAAQGTTRVLPLEAQTTHFMPSFIYLGAAARQTIKNMTMNIKNFSKMQSITEERKSPKLWNTSLPTRW